MGEASCSGRRSAGPIIVRNRPEHSARAKPTVVLWDMDDTIFDHALTSRAALALARRRYPALRGPTLDELWQEYGRLLGITHIEVMLGRRTSHDARIDRFRRLAAWAGHRVSADEARTMSTDYRDWYLRARRPVAGAPEAVRYLHRTARIGVVTNNTVAEQVEKIAFLGLKESIDVLVTSEEVGVGKPDPEIFRVALERTGAKPRDAVMIGDSWASDIAGARAAGIRAVWFNRFRLPAPAGTDVAELRSFHSPAGVARLLTG